MKPLIGVDIGSSAVRAVKVKAVDDTGFAIIDRVGVAPLRGGAAVAGGVIRNPQEVGQAVARAVQFAGGRRNDLVVLGASRPDTAVTRLALPAALTPDERVRAIRSMNVQISPTLKNFESVIATNLVREEHTGDRKLAALMVGAVAEEEIETLLIVAKIARLNVRAIDLAGAALLRALVRDLPTSKAVATLVDIGSTLTSVVTREGLYIRSSTAFAAGGIDLTRAIVTGSRSTISDAERQKQAMRLPTRRIDTPIVTTGTYAGLVDEEGDAVLAEQAQQTMVEQALSVAADNLVEQIAQEVEQDADRHGSMTREVALCGGTALMRGLQDRLRRRLNVDVHIGRPWAKLAANKHNEQYFYQGKEDAKLMLTLATATGLALWRDEK